MKIKKLQVGMGTNCYIVWDEKTQNAVVIDPGFQGKMIARFLKRNSLTLNYIFLTHGHYDHIEGIAELCEETGIRPDIFIHEKELLYQENPYRPGLGEVENLRFWKNNDVISMDALTFRIMETPGHSKGSVCILMDRIIFSGDTIGKNCTGMTCYPGGDEEELKKSLQTLFELEGNYVLCPGHEEETELAAEKSRFEKV